MRIRPVRACWIRRRRCIFLVLVVFFFVSSPSSLEKENKEPAVMDWNSTSPSVHAAKIMMTLMEEKLLLSLA